jgi:hypothetical protein
MGRNLLEEELHVNAVSLGTYLLYAVHPGDTVYSIADQLGTNVQLLMQINMLYPLVVELYSKKGISPSKMRYYTFFH